MKKNIYPYILAFLIPITIVNILSSSKFDNRKSKGTLVLPTPNSTSSPITVTTPNPEFAAVNETDIAEPIEVELTYLGESQADTSMFYKRYQLAEYVKFVWWYQYRSQEQVDYCEYYYSTTFPQMDFSNGYMIVSFGRKIDRITYTLNSKNKFIGLEEYEGVPEYDVDEWKANTMFFYRMNQIPFINSEVNTTENNNIGALNRGQMPNSGVHESLREKFRKYY